MIIDDDNSDEGVSKSEYIGPDLYKEGLTSVNGFTRGPNGRIKFHKDTKKRRREEMSEDDVEIAETALEEGANKSKKHPKVKVGQEFKAKVCSPSTFFERKLD